MHTNTKVDIPYYGGRRGRGERDKGRAIGLTGRQDAERVIQYLNNVLKQEYHL